MIELMLAPFQTVLRTNRVMLELYQLSDEDLSVLNIHRAEIPFIAYKSVVSYGES